MNRQFDQKDAEYRSTDPAQVGKEGFTLYADYNKEHHAYTFQYRGHGMVVQESKIMWEPFPMETLAQMATEFMKSVDKEVGWDWEPSHEKMGHGQILAELEASRRNAS